MCFHIFGNREIDADFGPSPTIQELRHRRSLRLQQVNFKNLRKIPFPRSPSQFLYCSNFPIWLPLHSGIYRAIFQFLRAIIPFSFYVPYEFHLPQFHPAFIQQI